MNSGRAQGSAGHVLVSKLPNKAKTQGLARPLCHDMTSFTFPARLFRPETNSAVFSNSAPAFLAQFFNTSGQRGLLKTGKHLDQVEFYWKAREEPDLCVKVSSARGEQ